MRKHLLALSFIALYFCTQASNNPLYEQRRQQFVDSSLLNATDARLIILNAWKGTLPDSTALAATVANGAGDDFSIIQLIRILFLTNGIADAKLLPPLYAVPYWINYGDTTHGYWSENHMIMWMSSDWLLHEKYGKQVDSNLHNRLVHYLDLKINYGFYEFLSSTYSPFSLSGLLNLSDFAQDAEIKSKATMAAERLLKTMLMLANDKGTYFPAAGRNYPAKYEDAYNQSHSNIIYLLTGLGPRPGSASIAGAILATSNFPVDSVIASYRYQLDTVLTIGHSLDTGFVLNSSVSALDKTVFQWSSGAYFHPDVVSETVQLLTDSNMWRHTDFEIFSPLASIVTPQTAPALANSLSCISKSSLICHEDVAIFKHQSITLSSALNFWKGKVGFQQTPCVANLGTTAVYTASGQVKKDWTARNGNNQNIHLPYVMQKSNLALIMYRPEPVPDLVGEAFTYKDVALHWKDSDFDQVSENNLWLMGRQGNSYVAVKRSCIGEIDSVRACPTSGGQTWVILVGDSVMYGSYSNFENIVQQAQFTEQWYFDSLTEQSVYYAKIIADNKTIEHAWGIDSISTDINTPSAASNAISIYPNPASNTLFINPSNIQAGLTAAIYNLQGQLVYSQNLNNYPAAVYTGSLAQGTYVLKLCAPNQTTSYTHFAVFRQ